MRKNEKFKVLIEDISHEGLGIGKVDGFVYFIKDAAPGDEIIAAVTKLKKNYGYARIVEMLKMSDHRVDTKCPIAGVCGGCKLQHLDYDFQLKLKEKTALDNLIRIAGFDEKLIKDVYEGIKGMDNPYRYRNKSQYPLRSENGVIKTGFYAPRSHNIIETEDCFIGIEENRYILRDLISFMKENNITAYDEESAKGLVRHALIRKAFSSGELMLSIVINGREIPESKKLIEHFCIEGVKTPDGVKKIKSLSLSVNTKKTNVIMGKEIINLYGEGYISDKIGNTVFRISPLSFYQVNPIQTEEMYETALEFADFKGDETAWDLYCGIGTISLFMANSVKHVKAVEIVPDAIIDAKKNAEINNIANVEFQVGAVEEIVPSWVEDESYIKPDVIMVDPPRKGLDEKTLETIVEVKPEKIVYVSCNSATMARDMAYLSENGYNLKRFKVIDNFPQTIHSECIALMEIKK